MADKNKLLKKRSAIKAKVTRFSTFLNSLNPDISQLRLRLAKVEECYDEYENIQSDLESLDENTSDDREEFERAYFEVVARAQSIIEDNSSTPANGSITSPQGLSEVRLPKIELPSFGGSYEEWMPFKDIYTSLIHNNPALSDIQKFHYLKSVLQAGPAQVIQSLQVTCINYPIAWQLLLDRYENKSVITQTHIRSLFELKKVEKETASSLRTILDNTLKHLRALKALGEPTDQWDSLIVYLITSKLNDLTLQHWETETNKDRMPTVEEITKFLQDRSLILEAVEGNGNHQPRDVKSKPVVRTSLNSSHQNACFLSNNFKCALCKEGHKIFNCMKFLGLSINDRKIKVKKLGLCFNCLGSSHLSKECTRGHCKHCQQRHNSLLHTNQDNSQDKNEANNTGKTSNSGQISLVSSATPSGHNHVFLATAELEVLNNRGQKVSCRAILDSASQSHYITQSLSTKLGLKSTKLSIPVVGIGGMSTLTSRCVTTSIQSKCSDFQQTANFLVIPMIIDKTPSCMINVNNLQLPAVIRLADPTFYNPNKIDILLGADIFWEIIGPQQLKSNVDNISFQETKLGWVVTGKTAVSTHIPQTVCHLSVTQQISHQLQGFWQLEECSNGRTFTGEDKKCEDHYKQNTVRLDTGRYVVKLPLKEGCDALGETRTAAEERFYKLEKRFEKQPRLRNQYCEFMHDYQERGHMEEADTSSQENTTYFYMPHHPVIKEGSTTTKLRVVFDGSCKSSNGNSLNDILMTGPIVQDELFSILVRFRKHNYVLCGDIEKMYRQIIVDPAHTSLQMILWRDDPSQPLKTYNLKTVTYGTACAPFLATRTLQQLAADEEDNFPIAAQVLRRDFYVDDLLTGAESIEQARNLQQQLVELLHAGGFNLRKWSANDDAILDHVRGDSKSSKETMTFHQETVIKTLGLIWDRKTDTFKFTSNSYPSRNEITKRTMLSDIARLFDPLGLIGPVIVKAKILLQQLWVAKIDWDTPLPRDLKEKWLNHQQTLASIEEFAIPRRITSDTHVTSVQLHGFCDASSSAYGCCVYMRCKDQDENISSHLVCSKSRVAPLKVQSIPRLELCAALLLTTLMAKVKEALNMPINYVHYWSDSSVVLCWISAPSTNWNVFVSNRVAKIQEESDGGYWHHVRTHDNPADLISRGILGSAITNADIWWNGPCWLSKDEKSWPISYDMETPEEATMEARKSTTLVLQTPDDDLLRRYSSFNRLKRIVAYCMRFARNARMEPSERNIGPLSAQELQNSATTIMKIGQQQMFPQELHELRKGKSCQRRSSILNLDPFIDNDGLLKVGGRLQKSELTYEQKHQVILHPSHHLTSLIVMECHMLQLHAGPTALLHAVRERYWPLRARQLMRTIVHQCVTCTKLRATSRSQMMGNLPSNRVTPSRPFLHTGVDYCGPVFVRQGKRRGQPPVKTFVAVFICMATRAIHIETVTDLSTNAFLGALRRFIARRGKPLHMYSDNATNFTRANKEIRELMTIVTNEGARRKIQSAVNNEGVEWHYIPPRSPHVGGIWEAGVKSFKYHFRRIVGRTVLTLEELNTLAVQIEACLNSRPLTYISNDPGDPSPLTPAHFLIGTSPTSLPETDLQSTPENHLNRWQHLQQMLQHFWSRWSREYLNDLQQRTKWKQQIPNLKEGAVVLLREDNLPPLTWKLGRVVTTHPGSDNVVRVVTVKTENGLLKRHVNKLCVLPV